MSDPIRNGHPRQVIAKALAERKEVNGGELESVLTIYNPEGLALLVELALMHADYRIVKGPTHG